MAMTLVILEAEDAIEVNQRPGHSDLTDNSM